MPERTSVCARGSASGRDRDRSGASSAQRWAWFFDELHPDNPVSRRVVAIRLGGPTQTEALRRSLQEVWRRHGALRTTFEPRDGVPARRRSERDLEFSALDVFDGHPSSDAGSAAAAFVGRRFDRREGPLFRAALLRIGTREAVLVLVAHAAVADRESLETVARESLAVYAALVGGRTPPPAGPAEDDEWVAREADRLDSPEGANALAYWRRRLADSTPTELPTDRARPLRMGFAGGVETVSLSGDVWEAAERLVEGRRIGPFEVLLAAFQALLHRYTTAPDVVVGVPRRRRLTEAAAPQVGPFENLLVLRTNVAGAPSFRALVARVEEALTDAERNEVPFGRLVEELVPEPDLGRMPLCQVQLVHETSDLPRSALLDACPIDLGCEGAAFDVTLEVRHEPGTVTVRALYRTDLFDGQTIRRLVGHFATLLRRALDDPDASIAMLPLLTDAERQQLLIEWNETRVDYGPPQTIERLFEAQAGRTPDAVAVVLADATLSYRELDERANALATSLRARGVGPEVLVGVCAERSLEMVIALVAVLKAGGAYLPLDPTYPLERLAFMLEDTGARVVLAQDALVDRLPAGPFGVLRLTPACADLHPAGARPPHEATADDLMYVMYTSGSTGKPKGTMITHRAAFDRLLWMQRHCGVGPADRLLQRAPFGFDVSVWEFFLPLISGAQLVLALPGAHADPTYLARAIARHRITLIGFVPSLLELFLKKPRLEGMESLRYVLCGAEVMSREVEQRFHERLPGRLYNLYGPTEICFHVTFWPCRPDHPWRTVPIGRPMSNSQVYVLDAHLQPLPVGVPGELYVGGEGLARGYLGRPELTAERFVSHPFSREAGARLYRTGDLARYLPDGNIEFVGRGDDQVKLRGFRIELGEVEAALLQHPGVSQAVAVLREDEPGNRRVVGYVVPAVEPAASGAELHAFLASKLPGYMVPSAFVSVARLPLTANGKVDRRALPRPGAGARGREPEAVPCSATERLLLDLWRQVLGVERPSTDDDFFALGGSYVHASRMAARLRESLGVSLPLRTLLETRTVACLAPVVEAAAGR